MNRLYEVLYDKLLHAFYTGSFHWKFLCEGSDTKQTSEAKQP